ncbi:phosphotransferase enzyme family [Zalerion maritima]|uniref:Phosphotransferase enzyme family n=1 Tax=Zalerion maritima TaxID=339359 RepID=A0AAD5RZU6_9PEZI|nr:phosphotransferase enzyme family [Zalerion maritima]
MPNTITFDATTKNPLGQPYMIKSYSNRCKLATELGGIYRGLLSSSSLIRHHRPGILTPMVDHDGKQANILDCPITLPAPFERQQQQQQQHPPLPPPARLHPFSPQTFTVHQFLKSVLEERKIKLIRQRNDRSREKIYHRLSCVADEMHAEGVLQDDNNSDEETHNENFVFCHLDLFLPGSTVGMDGNDDDNQNDNNDNHKKNVISAALDWDNVVFAPAAVACMPPSWLWAWDSSSDTDEDEDVAPLMAEDGYRKQLFDWSVGLKYCRLAYVPYNQLLRRISIFAIKEINSDESEHEARCFLGPWQQWKVEHAVEDIGGLWREEGSI